MLIAAALAAVCAAAFGIKVTNSTAVDRFDPVDGNCYYWSESALRFRHTRLISQEGRIPNPDTRLQYPEGIDIHRYDTVAMEHVYGRLHRWLFPDVPLHVFLIWAIAAFTTLSVVVCFFAGRALGACGTAAFVGALVYGLCPGSLGRTAGTFLREDFALPMLFGSFACMLACLRRERLSVAAPGALLLVGALASWHVSQFFWQIIVVGFCVLLPFYGRRRLPRQTFTAYTVAACLAALLLPVLRVKQVAVSMELMLGYALLIIFWILPSGWSRRREFWCSAALIVAFAAGALIIRSLGTIHSHVFDVLWGKLRYLGKLPADPALLSFDAKTYWVSGPFQSPSLDQLISLVSAGLIFSGAGLAVLLWRAWRRQLPADQASVLYFAAVFAVLFILFNRMIVFVVFSAGLLAAVAWASCPGRWRTAAAVLVVVCAIFDARRHMDLRSKDARPGQDQIADVVGFIREQSGPDDPVLATLELSSVICTYADRPVLIHSFYEAPPLRHKVRRLYTAFFEDEQTLHDVCREYGVRYMVYQNYLGLGMRPGSVAYNVGHVALPTSSAAFAFHFTPKGLHHFTLAHENDEYRIFRVGRSAEDRPLRPIYDPRHDVRMFVDGPVPEFLTAAHFRAGKRKINAFIAALRRAERSLGARRGAEAIAQYGEALRIAPHCAAVHCALGDVLEKAGRPDEAQGHYRTALRHDPEHVASLQALAINRAFAGRLDEAISLTKRALELKPDHASSHFNLGLMLWKQGRADEAFESCRRALQLDPDHRDARRLIETIRRGSTKDGAAPDP